MHRSALLGGEVITSDGRQRILPQTGWYSQHVTIHHPRIPGLRIIQDIGSGLQHIHQQRFEGDFQQHGELPHPNTLCITHESMKAYHEIVEGYNFFVSWHV